MGASKEIQRFMRRSHFKKLYYTKLEGLKEIGEFLDAYDLLKLIQMKYITYNRPITTKQ